MTGLGRATKAGLLVAPFALAATAVLVLSAEGAAPAKLIPIQEHPNVVVVMTDDQTVESMRALPKVQRLLAAEGVTFANSFASNPVCCPSRATFLTGRYSHNNGVYRNSPPHGGYTSLNGSRTLPVALQRSGYFTAHVGKYLNDYESTDVPPGWSEWYGAVEPINRMHGYTLNENGTLVTYGDVAIPDPATYQTDVYSEVATDLIERRAPESEPFFLLLAPLAPHIETSGGDNPAALVDPNPRPAPRHAGAFADEPLPRGAAYNEADVSDKPAAIRALTRFGAPMTDRQRRRYRSQLASLLAVDDMVSELVAALRESGELDDTLIIFTSDNGYLLGEHRIRFGKQYPYEESIRVPLVVRGPGVPRGGVRKTPVANVDLAPTILDYAGAPAAEQPDGLSLRELIEDRRLQPGRAILLENWCQVGEECFDPDLPRYQGVRTGRYAYMEYLNGERELYDLERDPFELDSLHDDPGYDGVRTALAELLAELRDCGGFACRAKPALKLKLSYRKERRGGRRCTTSAVKARVAGAAADEVLAATFFGPGGSMKDGKRRARLRVRLRELERRGQTPITANATVLDGRVVTVRGTAPRPC